MAPLRNRALKPYEPRMTPVALNFLAAIAAAGALSGCQQADDAAFGEKVRAYLLAHPEVIREAVQKLNENDRAGAAQAQGALVAANRKALENDPRDFVANPGGKITLVEFFDYNCGYCKVIAPEVAKIIQDNPDLRVVFKEMPIFGAVSDDAAKIALTPIVKAKGLEVYKAWMATKPLDEAAIDRTLKAAGIDPAVAREQAKDPAIQKHILDTRTLAQTLKLEGTPAFTIGDTLIPGADMAALKAAIVSAKAKDLKKP